MSARSDFLWHFEGGVWSVLSQVDDYFSLGDSLGEALYLAVEASRLGFTAAQPSATDLLLARYTSSISGETAG